MFGPTKPAQAKEPPVEPLADPVLTGTPQTEAAIVDQLKELPAAAELMVMKALDAETVVRHLRLPEEYLYSAVYEGFCEGCDFFKDKLGRICIVKNDYKRHSVSRGLRSSAHRPVSDVLCQPAGNCQWA